MEKLIKLIELEEGWKEHPYRCSEGYPTVGYGFKIGEKDWPIPYFSLPKVAGDAWLAELLNDIAYKLSNYTWYKQLNEPQRAVLISMVYQMGMSGVLKFKKMITALEQQDYVTAANEMLDSRWARQTENRANRHAIQLQSGDWHSYYS
jgi:lysozyme